MKKADMRKHNGGARLNAGRPSVADEEKKVTVAFYIKKKHVRAARLKLQPLVDIINTD